MKSLQAKNTSKGLKQTSQSLKQKTKRVQSPKDHHIECSDNPLKEYISAQRTFSPNQSSKTSDSGIQLTQILNYYRGRVEAFEKDRTQWYTKLESIRVKQDLVHKAEWEIKKRQEEKAELERVMLQIQNVLYNEREQLVKLKEQTDRQRIKGKENRQLILELLENNNAVEQHVYYQKDSAPEKIQSYSKKSLTKPQTFSNIQGQSLRKTLEEHKTNPTIHYDYKTPNILRTIYLPNDQATQIRSEVELLHSQIQDQRAHYEKLLNTLRDDKSDYEEKQRVQYIQYVEEIEQTLQKLQDQETFNYQVVKDHVELASQFEIEERKLQEETEAIRVENLQLRDQIRQVSSETANKKKEAKSEYEKSAHEYQERFRQQSQMQKENIAIIKDQYKKVQEIYKRKMGDMEERLHKETKKMEIAERRRKLDLDGYGADLSAMKKKIEFYTKYIIKLKKLVNEDQAELMDVSEEEEGDNGEENNSGDDQQSNDNNEQH